MAVANETLHAALTGIRPPIAVERQRRTKSAQHAQAVRGAVNSALLDALAVMPDETCLSVLEAGRGDNATACADVVIADFGLIHRGSPANVAAELMRICRPGGRLGLACPVPGSFLDEVHARIQAYTPSSGAEPSPGFTGTREGLDAVFGGSAIALGARERSVTLTFASTEHWLAEWQRWYAPLRCAYQQIDPAWRGQFTSDLLSIAGLFAESDEGELSIRCDYLEFVAHMGQLQ